MYCRLSFVLISLFFLPLFLFGQIRQKGTPLGLNETFLEQYAQGRIPTLEVPLYDYNKYVALQRKYPDFLMNAVGTDVQINLQNEGEWLLLENGDRLWRLKIEVRGTESLTFLYDDFWLPKGSKFYLYSADESQILGAFTHENNKVSGTFSTATIYDDGVYLEYLEPLQVSGQGRINIHKIMQKPHTNARSGGEFGFNAASACHININCAQGRALREQQRGVMRIVMFLQNTEATFLGYCTGTLMNNTRQDQTPYILSAFHCLIPGFTPLFDMWQFDFGYETPSCDNPAIEPTPRTIIGCEQVAGREDPDFLLLKLNNPIPSSFNPYFCGWNIADNTVPRVSRMISHPCGDIKKITVDNRNSATIHPTSTNWAEYTSSPNSHFRVEFDQGFSQLGGSGSGLFGDDGLVYGQLHGGNVTDSTCAVNRLFFGRLSQSWQSNMARTRLRDWLNPTNENITTLQGFDPFESAMSNLSGTINTPFGKGIAQVSVQFTSQDTSVTVLTDATGNFQLSLPRTAEYQVRFSKELNVSNGVTTFDLVRIRQHILGAVPFEDAIMSLAADVNISNSVTTFDVVEIRKAILGVYESFPVAPSWGFISPEGTLFNVFTLNNLSPEVVFSITAIKMGDVNYSADPSN